MRKRVYEMHGSVSLGQKMLYSHVATRTSAIPVHISSRCSTSSVSCLTARFPESLAPRRCCAIDGDSDLREPKRVEAAYTIGLWEAQALRLTCIAPWLQTCWPPKPTPCCFVWGPLEYLCTSASSFFGERPEKKGNGAFSHSKPV